jgi:hypothetical protein
MGGLVGGGATPDVGGGKPHQREVGGDRQVEGGGDLGFLHQERVVSTPINPRSTIVTDQVFVHGTSDDDIEAESRGDTAAMSRTEMHGWHHTWHPREIG